jgi:hypothetical protein
LLLYARGDVVVEVGRSHAIRVTDEQAPKLACRHELEDERDVDLEQLGNTF